MNNLLTFPVKLHILSSIHTFVDVKHNKPLKNNYLVSEFYIFMNILKCKTEQLTKKREGNTIPRKKCYVAAPEILIF